MPAESQPPLRKFGDHAATRQGIYAGAYQAVTTLPPAQNSRYALGISDVGWSGPETPTLADHKRALVEGRSLTRRLTGTVTLTDKATNAPVDSRRMTIAAVPALTDQGVFVHEGSSSVVSSQLRLLPGMYARKKGSGSYELHINTLPGTGVPHRVELDPATGVFKTVVGQAEIPTITLLKVLGATPEELRKAWGDELYAKNSKADRPHHVEKYWERMGPPGVAPDGTDKAAVLAQRVGQYPLDPWVSKRTLGKPYDRYGKEPLLVGTAKLLRIARGEQEPDDRDNPAFSTVWGPEHLVAERLARSGPLMAKILWQATNTGNLKRVQPGFLSPAVRALFTKSGLAMNPEGTSAAEFMDHGSRITKIGEGGIGKSAESVPSGARSVHPAQFPFIDGVRTSESETVGVDLRVAFGTRLGADKRIYAPLRDPKTNKLVFRSIQDLDGKTLAFPGAMHSDMPVVPVIKNGKITYAPKGEVDYVVPSMEQSFSPMTNMVPLKSTAKPHRSSMAARMATQSLPLLKAEAPLVRSQVPGQPGRSFEEMFGRHMGAVFAKNQPGQVVAVEPDSISVRYADGTTEKHERYNNFPSGRKTGYQTEPLVRPGDAVAPGQILAKSNFTDEKGHAAYGLNLRTGFLNMKLGTYEDSVAVSESAAKRLVSDHLYHHHLPYGDDVLIGKTAHVAAFPGKHSLEKLKNFDEDGTIKVGTRVEEGDPLILAVRKKQGAFGRLSRSGKAALSDASDVWEYSEPGVVSDVYKTKNGPVVLVRSSKPLQTGDKVSGRAGNKGVAVIYPDDEMPVGQDGKPLELVMSSLGVISRANASQIYETLLGKIAAKTGRPYVVNDWDDEGKQMDVGRFVKGELAKHGMKAKEDLIDPKTGRTIPNVLTGQLYLMKLHHMSQSKVKGRGLGGYDESGQPIRGQNGGAMRASLGDTNALLSHGATSNIFDAHAYRGQDNPDFWLSLMSGYPATRPAVSKPFERFLTELRAAGVDPVKRDGRYHLMALKDKKVQELAGNREVKNGETLDFSRNGEPVPGGLFSPELFGSVDSSCFLGSTKILCRDGFRRIDSIVNGQLPVEVLSYNRTTGLLEYKPVTGYIRARNTDSLVKLKYSGGGVTGLYSDKSVFNSLYVTPNHGVYQAGGEITRADQLNDHVLMPTLRLGDNQRALLYGRLLGDAGINPGRCGRSGSYQASHSSAQEAYVRYISRLLAPFVGDRVSVVTRGEVTTWSSQTAEFSDLRRAWYRDRSSGHAQKVLPPDFEATASVLTLATWFFDDGWTSLQNKEKPASRRGGFCTQGFEVADVERLANWLSSVFGIHTTRKRKVLKGGEVRQELLFNQTGFSTLKAALERFVPPGMGYKLGTSTADCSGYSAYDFSPKPPTVVRRPLLASATYSGVSRCSYRPAWVYDIQVEDNHNYFANGVLVSNSTWAKITLHESVLNPALEEPARRLLGLTEKQFREVVAGRQDVRGETGMRGLFKALAAVDVPKELAKARLQAQSSRKTAREEANRRLFYLKGLERTGQSPKDWFLSAVPVLPPAFRPVSAGSLGGKSSVVVHDSNLVYADLLNANHALRDLSKEVDDVGDERLNLYDAVKAVVGLGDPVGAKNKERGVKGVLGRLLGDTSKHSYLQTKLLGTPVNLSGRGQAVPNPDLDLDEIGIPESMARDIYHPFVIRRLVRGGMSRVDAAREVESWGERAKKALLDEMGSRPVLATRYPALHRYNVMAFHPRLVPGDALHINHLVTKSYAADFDGDAFTINVPLSDDAVKEAYEKLLPSKNLYSPASFKPTNYQPNMEVVGGLHAASTADEGNPPVEFATRKDAIKAYLSGDPRIKVGTRVRIHDES